jgi:hypothetical protein
MTEKEKKGLKLFQVDKEQSIKIAEDIFSRLNEEGQVSLNENMNIEDHYSSDYEDDHEIIEHKHKLAVVEITLPFHAGGNYYKDKDVEDMADELDIAIKEGDFNRSVDIEIYTGSCVTDDREVSLEAYLHGTGAECDVSHPTFMYSDKLKCWIIKDGNWGAENGIDCNDTVTMLDFSDYNKLVVSKETN